MLRVKKNDIVKKEYLESINDDGGCGENTT